MRNESRIPTSELFLRDVIDIKEDVHAGDFKIELSGGFTETEARVAEYVATDQLQQAFRQALGLVGKAVRTGTSHAACLHGSSVLSPGLDRVIGRRAGG